MQLHNRHIVNASRNEESEKFSDVIDLEALLGIARRQWTVVAICIFAMVILGLIYVFTAVPLYTATSSVLIDRGNSQVIEQVSTVSSALEDESSVLSQVELLKSDAILRGVVDKLDLLNNPEFNASTGSIFSTIKSTLVSIANVSQWFGSDDLTPDDIEVRKQGAMGQLLLNMDMSRIGRTYVLSISYTSVSSTLSSKIVNAISEGYLLDKLNSKYDATRRASTWLQDRIAELRQKALESDLAVQKFRTANGLVSSGTLLVSDQQLSELNSALIVAQSDTAKARARLQRIQQIIATGQSDAIVTDVLDSSISNELRKKYLDASKLEADISKRLGENHVQAVRLRGEMEEYKRLMFEELNRIAESYKSELDVANARERSLADSVSQATSISATANETQVQLRELEREAETYKNLYQTFLQRYQEAVQQQSFPVTDARIISYATPPKGASFPRKPLVLALFFILGAAIGGSIGALREFRDRFFRTGEQVRSVLNLEFLGATPLIAREKAIPPGDKATESDVRLIRPTSSAANYVVEHPLSAFAETMRSSKIAMDLSVPGKKCKVIGVVSTLPGEGKSTVATNLARLLASQGAKTVLIDGDLRNPGATRLLARHAQAGLLEVLLEGRDVRDALVLDPKTRLVFIPAVVKQRVPHSSELLASIRMQNLLTKLGEEFDYIILDLPPLGPVIDARAIAGKVDGFIYVVEWGKTGRRAVRQTLETEPLIYEKCLGVILNKVDQERMKLYRLYGSNEYYYSRYSQYYQEEH